MGRETKLLLALLATLAGVFVGVLTMKLLSKRPPVGAGPDVHVDTAAAEPHLLVAPPDLSAPLPELAAGERYRPDAHAARQSRGRAEESPAGAAPEAMPPRRDPFVTAASLEQPLPEAVAPAADRSSRPVPMPAATVFAPPPAPQLRDDLVAEPFGQPTDATLSAAGGGRVAPATAAMVTHEVMAGESWWDLAERAYGDGRLYRALFAWNRVVDPRVSLTPGTRLEIPPRERLEAAWPKLLPPR